MKFNRELLKLYDKVIINWSLYFELPEEDISIEINEDRSYNLHLKFSYLRLQHIMKQAFKVNIDKTLPLQVWSEDIYTMEVGSYVLNYKVPKRSEAGDGTMSSAEKSVSKFIEYMEREGQIQGGCCE